MNEYDSTCDNPRFCNPYQHSHCSACGSIVDHEPCCGDSSCGGYGYANGSQCKTCTDCVLCNDCKQKCAICPHCVEYESALADREYAHG